MWVYEQNYQFFVRFFSELCDGSKAELRFSDEGHHLSITVLEQAPYTQTIRCHYMLGKSSHWLEDMRMVVRLYHDARLAEVLHYQESEKLKSDYASSNPELRHKDEKKQANRLLWEWFNRLVKRRTRADGVLELNT